ncbi:hypothetical protein RMN57_08625 [Kitasatospora sp. CM 4170]|uniref:ApeI dehydratase-like domain-containing protein n=1 Tax=Kitasatospora aburaviensis TaxID=67265 RepID=A0ABW1EV59_9ACTN|nr:hypothetical protein [Kitasatospora sp. CM 4170]WNM44777.1 hypothetical protein RMN57_08625 [Kitasatospora sp. CM 4170]
MIPGSGPGAAARTGAAGPAAPAPIRYVASLEPVFSGPCDGFPILPGVSLLDYAWASADANLPVPGLHLQTVDRARFSGAAFPGDELSVELAWAQQGPDEWTCAVTVATPRGPASSARLRYGAEAAR